ncbi:MAG: hypothetical protein K0U63_02645 [Cyanobacteria bacterium]|nr:hypothetical protein [Cyanobacteriota bacterium]
MAGLMKEQQRRIDDLNTGMVRLETVLEITLNRSVLPMQRLADYDPTVRFKQGEALSAVSDAERALVGLQAAQREEQVDFITLALGMTRS